MGINCLFLYLFNYRLTELILCCCHYCARHSIRSAFQKNLVSPTGPKGSDLMESFGEVTYNTRSTIIEFSGETF